MLQHGPRLVRRRYRAVALTLCLVAAMLGTSRPAAAQTPRRVLYLYAVAAVGAYAHESRVHAGEVLAALGQSSGAYTLAATDDPNVLNDATLALYDAVVFFTAGELAINDAQKAALLAFVAGGKGFVGVHSATNTFYTWPEYGEMIGGYFVNHPWEAVPGAVLRVEDRGFPATSHLGASFNWVDELYEFRSWSRAKVHVLLSLDTTSVNAALGGRTDNDYALAWVRRYGNGRVFYSALGHESARWDDPRLQRHMLGGLLWALGLHVNDEAPIRIPDLDGETARPSTEWHFAEGATGGDFSLFYLLENPGMTATTATVRYLLPGGAPPIVRTYALAPHSRTTIAVDEQTPALASTDVAAAITTPPGQPIVVERAMYRSTPDRPFATGVGSSGVTAPATRWFLAEGATGAFFDQFILIANPGAADAQVRVTWLLSDGGTLRKDYVAPASSRTTIWVDEEVFPGGVKPLASISTAAIVESLNSAPIVVERTMWWPSPAFSSTFWTAAHNSAGATAAGTRWAFAEGEAGGALDAETYILIANTSAFAGRARVTLHFDDGSTASREVALASTSRTTLSVSSVFPEASNRRFGAVVESLGTRPPQIVVERAMYTSLGGARWTAGTDAMATRVQ